MELKKAKLHEQRFKIQIQFPEHDKKLVSEIKKLGQVSIRGNYWELAVSEANIKALKKLGFVLHTSLLKTSNVPVLSGSKQTKLKTLGSLYNYQKEGVVFVESKNGRALIADEMGLGKTVQALSWVNINRDKVPVVIVCPGSLKLNWFRETKKWVKNSSPIVLEGQSPYSFKNNFVIINYEILPYWMETLRAHKFQTLIADEVHYIKNSKAKRTIAFKRLSSNIPNIIGLTGTPIENKPAEIYNIVNVINPLVFPNYYSFVYRYCGAKRNPWGGIDTTESTNQQELHTILKNTVMIRRRKAEVLKELPPKQIVRLPVKIDNLKEYKEAENAFIQYLRSRYFTMSEITKDELLRFAKEQDIDPDDVETEADYEKLAALKIEKAKAAPVLVQIAHLKRLAVEGKMNEIIEWIQTFLESGEKLVVFAINKEPISQIMKAFPGCLRIDGSVSMAQRQVHVDKFQSDPSANLLVANMRAGGVGFTMTAASNVAILQYPWNPGELHQAIDRVHRITQMKQVTAWALVGENTIEERLIEILVNKQKMIDGILDGEYSEQDSIFNELINSYK